VTPRGQNRPGAAILLIWTGTGWRIPEKRSG
jgi:hypothetical protein